MSVWVRECLDQYRCSSVRVVACVQSSPNNVMKSITLRLPFCLYVYACIPYICLYVRLSICLSIHVSVAPPIDLVSSSLLHLQFSKTCSLRDQFPSTDAIHLPHASRPPIHPIHPSPRYPSSPISKPITVAPYGTGWLLITLI